jgi:hypothetical protein
LNSFDASGRPKILAMGVQDRPAPSSASSEGFFNNGGMQQGGKGGLARFMAAFRRFPTSPTVRCMRGVKWTSRGKRSRAVSSPCFASSEPPAIRPGTSGRLELAEWLTSPANPLTARVMTNRIWHWLFGRGIVESVDNLGSTGHLSRATRRSSTIWRSGFSRRDTP